MVVGGRWTRDEKDAVLSATGVGFRPFLGDLEGCGFITTSTCGFTDVEVSETFSDFTGKASINYKINDEHSVYALWAQGFKSGGFQNAARSALGAAEPFDSETVNNFELGWKGQINNQARFSLTGFRQRAEGVQTVTLVDAGGGGFTSVTSNVGAVRALGIEGDLTYLVSDNFRFGGTFAAIDAELQDTIIQTGANPDVFVDLSGQRPEVAPRWTGTAYAEYDFNLANGSILSVRGDFTGRDSIFDGNEDRATTLRIRPTTTNFGGRVAYDFGEDLQYRIMGWTKNINEDEDINNIGPSQPNTTSPPVGFALKRQWGVTVSANF